ncbi:MAG: hypothetical protein ACLPWS_00925 [Rhodomicrobium sp.]
MDVRKEMLHFAIVDHPSVELIGSGNVANISLLAKDGTPILLTISVAILREMKAGIDAALSASPLPNPDR